MSCETEKRRQPARNMQPSEAAIDLIKEFEGLRLEAYEDAGGKWTIGYGHLMTGGEPQKIDEAQALYYLRLDIAKAAAAVKALAPVPLWQSEFDALVSFTFNVGSGNFAASTMRRKLLDLDYVGASEQFPRWVYVNGRKFRGLERRRKAEQKLFNTVPF